MDIKHLSNVLISFKIFIKYLIKIGILLCGIHLIMKYLEILHPY